MTPSAHKPANLPGGAPRHKPADLPGGALETFACRWAPLQTPLKPPRPPGSLRGRFSSQRITRIHSSFVKCASNHDVLLALAKRSGLYKTRPTIHPTLLKRKSRSVASPCLAKHASLFTRRTHPAKQAAQAAICRSINVIPQPRKSHPANKRRFDVSQTLFRKRTPICCSMNVTLKTNGDLLQFSRGAPSTPPFGFAFPQVTPSLRLGYFGRHAKTATNRRLFQLHRPHGTSDEEIMVRSGKLSRCFRHTQSRHGMRKLRHN